MDLTDYSAYGGGSWQKRCHNICPDDTYAADDGSINPVWSLQFGINSEYMPLKIVHLNFPTKSAISFANQDPERFQLLDKVDFNKLWTQLHNYAYMLDEIGILAVTANSHIMNSHPNFIFARDLFSMTPKGAILGRPATRIRAGEELGMMMAFSYQRTPILATIVEGSFEGADMLWLAPDAVAIDHSSRTTMDAANRIESILKRHSIFCMHTHINVPGNQHLLGVCNIVNDHVACIRTEKIPQDLVDFMDDIGYKFIEFDETEEVVYKQAMNLVTVAPGEVFMPHDCPETEDKLLDSGHVTKIHSVDITELRKMAGGLACLTGIVHRELL